MKATLNTLLMIFLGLSLSFCSSSSKDEDETLSDSSDSAYDSSSTYDDIASASGGADDDLGDTSDYATDDYGSADTDTSNATDDFLLGGTEDEEPPAADPLPVQRLEEADTAPVMDTPSSDFKDGFYNIATNCNMRSEPDAGSANEGKIKAGKRLWVEGYNDGWVKVFKRAGPVFISKVCL